MLDHGHSSSKPDLDTTQGKDDQTAFAMPTVVSRLFLFSLKEVLAARYGLAATVDIIREGGRLAGRRFAENALDLNGAMDYFINNTQNALMQMNLGALRMEKAEERCLEFTLTLVKDPAYCRLPHTQAESGCYDEGFLEGVLEAYMGKQYRVRQVDCWENGERTCRFEARPECDI